MSCLTRAQARAIFEGTTGPATAKIHFKRVYKSKRSTGQVEVQLNGQTVRLDHYGKVVGHRSDYTDWRGQRDSSNNANAGSSSTTSASTASSSPPARGSTG